MKRILPLLFLLLTACRSSVPGLHPGTGTIRGIYPAEKSITITHEPMPSLRMGSMTMAFAVPEEKLLEGLKVDQRVQFEVEQKDGDYVIRSIRPLP